jgi:hypothetical protein
MIRGQALGASNLDFLLSRSAWDSLSFNIVSISRHLYLRLGHAIPRHVVVGIMRTRGFCIKMFHKMFQALFQ